MIEQQVRFVPVTGGRVAVATAGSGPPLVVPGLWISHVELEWEFPEYRRFVTRLAETRTVIRHDRLGVGLSDPAPGPPDVRTEAVRLGELADALGLDSFALLGISWGGCAALALAAARPDRVARIATHGVPVRGADVAPEPLRRSMVDTVLAHWGAGSRMLADVWIPGADAATRDRFARLQRAAAGAEAAAAALRAVYASDVSGELGAIRAPTLVTHRRDDRAVPFAAARELAAGVPGARLVALPGRVHVPWLGDADSVLAALMPFLGATPERAPVPDAAGPLTDREAEVLRLVAAGLADPEIAARLQLSPHTVHRHVANIRTKLDQPSRAAAVAAAARLGLI